MNNPDGSSWPYAGVDGAAAAAWNDVQRNGNMVSSIRTCKTKVGKLSWKIFMESICVFHFLDLVLLDHVIRGLTVGYQLIYNNRVLPAITASRTICYLVQQVAKN